MHPGLVDPVHVDLHVDLQPAYSHLGGSGQSGVQRDHGGVIAAIGNADAQAAYADFQAAPTVNMAPVDNELVLYDAVSAPAADGPGDELDNNAVVYDKEATVQQHQEDEEQLGVVQGNPNVAREGVADAEGEAAGGGVGSEWRRTRMLSSHDEVYLTPQHVSVCAGM